MKATISHLFGGLKVHKTPNGKVIDELWPGYHVETTGEKRSTATVNWVKIHYLFDGKDKLGWVSASAPRKVGGERYATLDPDPPPPDFDTSHWEDDGGRAVDPSIFKAPTPPFKLHRTWGEWVVTAACALAAFAIAVWLALTYL